MSFIDPKELDKETDKLIDYLGERDLTNQEVVTLLRHLIDYIRARESVEFTGELLKIDKE